MLQIRTLTEKLQSVTEASSEENKELQSRLVLLYGKNEELQERLEMLQQEKKQLRADLESSMEMVCVCCYKSVQMLSEMTSTSTFLHFQVSALQEKLKEHDGRVEAELQQVCLFATAL